MKLYKTDNCVHCGRLAVIFTGHVHKRGLPDCFEGDKVVAGWCKKCSDEKADETIVFLLRREGCMGCFGTWHTAFGIRDEGLVCLKEDSYKVGNWIT